MKKIIEKLPIDSNYFSITQTEGILDPPVGIGLLEIENQYKDIYIKPPTTFYLYEGGATWNITIEKNLHVRYTDTEPYIAIWKEGNYIIVGEADASEISVVKLALVYRRRNNWRYFLNPYDPHIPRFDHYDVYKGCGLRLGHYQTIPTNTITVIEFYFVDWGIESFWDDINFYYRIPFDGIYKVNLKVATQGDWSGSSSWIRAYKNDEDNPFLHGKIYAYTTQVERSLEFNAGDKIQFKVYQVTGEDKYLYMQPEFTYASIIPVNLY